MDPPRTGSDEAFLSSVVRLAPDKVVYVSCGPETLVRDLKYLTKHGYRMKECTQFFESLPTTKPVETVCLLSKLFLLCIQIHILKIGKDLLSRHRLRRSADNILHRVQFLILQEMQFIPF